MIDAIFTQTVIGLFTACFIFLVFSGVKIRALKMKYKEVLLINKSLQGDLSAMCAAVVDTGVAIGVTTGDYVDKQDTNTRTRTVQQSKHERVKPQNRSISQARVLLDNGAEIGDVIDNCGISYGEAELIAMMNKLEPQPACN